MKNKKLLFLVLAVLLLVASPVFAADAATGGTDQSGLKMIGIGIGMGIASGLCALGQGRATAGACEAMARNPGNTAAIRTALIIGLALIESLGLYTFVIVFGK
jgi:F-type H+-transporting ATPase subunit c